MMPSDNREKNPADAEGLFRSLVGGLISHLDAEIVLYRVFESVVRKERDILLHPSPDIVHVNNLSKEECLLKARELETARMRIIGEIASLFNKPQSAITISFLLPCLEKEQREALRSRQQALLTLAADVKRINDTNGDIADSALANVKKSFNFINNLKAMHAGYMQTGKTAFGSRNGMLLCQEV
jgi:flagellar biosynthesis/type III secretory pathway chaperone